MLVNNSSYNVIFPTGKNREAGIRIAREMAGKAMVEGAGRQRERERERERESRFDFLSPLRRDAVISRIFYLT